MRGFLGIDSTVDHLVAGRIGFAAAHQTADILAGSELLHFAPDFLAGSSGLSECGLVGGNHFGRAAEHPDVGSPRERLLQSVLIGSFGFGFVVVVAAACLHVADILSRGSLGSAEFYFVSDIHAGCLVHSDNSTAVSEDLPADDLAGASNSVDYHLARGHLVSVSNTVVAGCPHPAAQAGCSANSVA